MAAINDAERSGSELITPFDAMLSGPLVGDLGPAIPRRVKVLAVLERTAVVCPAGYVKPAPADKALGRLSELHVDREVIRWKEATQELRFGHDGKVSPHGLRRCPQCGRREGETEFRPYRTSYCIACARELSRNRRRRLAAA